MNTTRRILLTTSTLAVLQALAWPTPGLAASAAELAKEASGALAQLYAKNPKTKELGSKATAILVFPKIVKAGLVIGGQSGDGALLRGGKAVAFYNISAASFGLQAGAQTFSYALFFMNEKALTYLDKSDGWAVGSGPSVVVADEAFARSVTSTTLTQDVYAVPFGQKGLMAGLGLEGSKITRIHPK
ncbi:MAG: YSC84-related protein [Acetobacteraceae bacterium]